MIIKFLNKNKKHFLFLIGSLLSGIMAGCAAAFFLFSLNFLTNFRENHLSLIYFLPIAGIAVVWIYENIDANIKKGNSLIISQTNGISSDIPFLMAPAVLMGTLITHLFGGSAGREGTALQMSGAMTDSLAKYFGLDKETRQNLLICSIAAGFAAVFGTPLAGAIFAFEVSKTKKYKLFLICNVLMASFVGHWICGLFQIEHTHYSIGNIPSFSFQSGIYVVVVSICFGLAAWLFVHSMQFFSLQFKRIENPYLRVFIGGSIVLGGFIALGNSRLHGLGISTILETFIKTESPFSFAFKIILTAITLSSGMKGGEVTPLFLIGALLGSALSAIIPLPTALLAGLGFVAVFAGASKTPIACFVLGLEIFGFLAWPFLLICCITTYFCSGKKGIYESFLNNK